jgi:hypothetical protein
MMKSLSDLIGKKPKNALLPDLPSKGETEKLFRQCCKELDVNPKAVEDLVIYELTDGTRTSTDLSGWEAYYDGSLFSLRLAHMLSLLGSKHFYVLTAGEGHQARDNWQDIMQALVKSVALWKEYVAKHNMRLKFIGNVETLRGKGFDQFIEELRKLEQLSLRNTGMITFVLINYSADWAYSDPRWQAVPNANVIVKHTKGQVNEGLWLPGKLKNNSFVYVQQGSCSSTWTDKQLLWFIAMCTRSMALHQGMQYSKSYAEGEKELMRQKRENEMSFVHRKLAENYTKRVVMFSHLGPEVYEF